MPLPAADSAWPPPHMKSALEMIDVYDKWWVGDIDELSEQYRNTPISHRAQLNGGVVGTAARAWLGKPQSPNEGRSRYHYPLAADIAGISAALLWAEPARWVIPGATTAKSDGTITRSPVQEALETLVNTPRFHASLLEAAEVQSPHGGVYFRLVWDTVNLRQVRAEAVHADNAVPEFLHGDLHAVTFWTELPKDDDSELVHRHLEYVEKGASTHALYEGTDSNIGRRVPYTERPETAWLAKLDLADGDRLLTGIPDALTACYIPNMRPNKHFRKMPGLAPLGQSDYSDVLPLFDAADEVLSSWMRDIRLAKARIIVPNGYLQSRGAGQGGFFDTDREVYEGLEFAGGSAEGGPLTMQQFDIRVAEHNESLTELTKFTFRRAGYSMSSLGESESGMRTATEVKSDDRMSERTRDKKTNYWKALGEFAHTWLRMQSVVYGGVTPKPDEIPEVRFPAESQVDIEAISRTVQMLRAAKAASIETAVRMLHPEWDGNTVNEEVERIKLEEGIGQAADPSKIKGLDGVAPAGGTSPAQIREMIQKLEEEAEEQADAASKAGD